MSTCLFAGILTACAGCSNSGHTSSGGSHSSGGTSGATGGSGASNSGGTTTGGAAATGGIGSSGGASPAGGAGAGATATGGAADAGAASSTGGASGSNSTGGSKADAGSGGITPKGGAGASGGSNASGGKAASGGSAGSVSSGGKSAGTGGNATAGSSGVGGSAATGGTSATGGAGGDSCGKSYDQVVSCDEPVGFWAMNMPSGTQEPDLSGKGSPGSYKGPAPTLVALPNGDQAANFNGSSNYLTIPSKAAFSIPTTGNLTWEAWIRPSILQFPNNSGGYVDWMGKCADYSPSCEWEARMYNTTNDQDRCNRLSAYVFNPGAGLGSGADWQPTCGLFQANAWLHVVGEYTTLSEPANCANPDTYPGGISIWVNGVEWNHSRHGQTGCFSQYSVVPKANTSPVNVGTMAGDAWFQGAIGKVAIYDFLLSQAQITNHYRTMTGKAPTGACQDTCTF